jgi:hypothetical protein
MGFSDDDQSYLTQQEINYCQRLNETLDAHQASAELDKRSYSKPISFFENWKRSKQKKLPNLKKK